MTRLFVHCGVSVPYVSQLATISPVFDRFPAERSLVLARRGDVVCLLQPTDTDYLAFLGSLGLGPAPDDVLVIPPREEHDRLYPLCHRIREIPESFNWLVDRIRTSRRVVMYPFIASASHWELAAALEAAAGTPVRVLGSEPRLIDRADRKDHMRAKARELGLPIAEGEAVRMPCPGGRRRQDVAPLRDAILRYLNRTGRVLVRGAFGAAGTSSFIVGRDGSDLTTVIQEITCRADNEVYLVEVMVDATASPNVQMHVAPDDGAITCAGVTEQRWSRPLVHAGNLFPCVAGTMNEMVSWSYVFAEWLRSEGYLGLVGFDFVEYREPNTGRLQVLFAEVNPRINGSTFPMTLLKLLNEAQRRARRPESAAFVSGAVETSARSFAQLRELIGHLFYRPETGTGAVPYLNTLLPAGKFTVAVFGGSVEEVTDALVQVRQAGAGTVAMAPVV